MQKHMKTLCALLCATALSGCACQSPVVKVVKPDQVTVPALSPELTTKHQPNYCQRLLTILQVSPSTLTQKCGEPTSASTVTKP